ncbi:MAG TPA: peptidoglycan-binding domain-containing protein, partial [Polyangiaceae bacterium]|nr:peptidoglycan-binding domain-containing protein [Polyangiaceae bacterium]
ANELPIAGTAWSLRHSAGEVSDVTGTDGLIAASVPVGAGHAVLTLDGYTIDVELDALPPVEETSGLQYRLNNLNYDCGPVTGVMTPATHEAVRVFQSEHPPLAVTGEVDALTQERVRLAYGH